MLQDTKSKVDISLTSEELTTFREQIQNAFNSEELKTLCLDLKINYDTLAGAEHASKTRELLAYCRRTGRLYELIIKCQNERPRISWYGAPVNEISPFKGLQAFDTTDADLFFGRKKLTTQLIKHLNTNSFLVVVGPSGSGKSSIVRAGIVPNLLQEDNWLITEPFKPGEFSNPLKALAHPIIKILEPEIKDTEIGPKITKLADEFYLGNTNLSDTVDIILKKKSKKRLLLVVDQFEELFTVAKDSEQNRKFVVNLLNNLENNKKLTIIITLRTEFLHHCAVYPKLQETVEKHKKFVGAMNEEELKSIITGPAHQMGLQVEPDLVDFLIRDVGDRAGTLPLLSHALLETWKRREGNRLTKDGYFETGRVHRAIAKTADSTFTDNLDPEQRLIAQNIFLRLTGFTEVVEVTRRRASLNEFISKPEDQPSVEKVLEILADARLISTDHNSAEVTHEALLREWPTLQGWLHENAEALYQQRQLTEAANDWDRHQRNRHYLYRGSQFKQAKSRSDELTLSLLEQEFLQAAQRSERQRLFLNLSVPFIIIITLSWTIWTINQEPPLPPTPTVTLPGEGLGPTITPSGEGSGLTVTPSGEGSGASGNRLVFFYNPGGFYAWNAGDRDITIRSLVLTAVDAYGNPTGKVFEARRWAGYYPAIRVGSCDRLEILNDIIKERPGQCQGYDAIMTPEETDPMLFWLASDNASQFMVTYSGQEIGRCDIAAGQCEVVIP